MTQSQRQSQHEGTKQNQSENPGRSANTGDSTDVVTLQVTIRPDHIVLLRRFATREGASVEALASLWLEEKLDEALRSLR